MQDDLTDGNHRDNSDEPSLSARERDRVTLAKIAREAGVNKSTASRALHGDPSVADATRRRIQQLADELHYVPNASAMRLSNAQTNVLAFASHGFVWKPAGSDPFLVELLTEITQRASAHGFDVLLCRYEPGERELETYRRVVLGRYADGLILTDLRPNDPRLEYLCEQRYPHVLFGRSAADLDEARRYPYPWVEVDNRAGARLGTEHLLSLGHRRIAFVGGSEVYFCEADRLMGYRDALEAGGVPFDPRLCVGGGTTHEEEDGYRLTCSLLEEANPPTAVFAFSDVVATGVMQAAREMGRAIGREFGIMGFDGLGLGNYTTPALTTLRQPIRYVGRMLVDLLHGALTGPPPEDPHLLLQPELMVRASTIGD
ncbi:MAG: LacI family DNA-binding transcriptional regulator [Ktedonobacterales bacterium]